VTLSCLPDGSYPACSIRVARVPQRVAAGLLVAVVLAQGEWLGRAAALLPAGAIAFVHEDSGSTDPLRQIFNLRLTS
jgi:hypothetical protein